MVGGEAWWWIEKESCFGVVQTEVFVFAGGFLIPHETDRPSHHRRLQLESSHSAIPRTANRLRDDLSAAGSRGRRQALPTRRLRDSGLYGWTVSTKQAGVVISLVLSKQRLLHVFVTFTPKAPEFFTIYLLQFHNPHSLRQVLWSWLLRASTIYCLIVLLQSLLVATITTRFKSIFLHSLTCMSNDSYENGSKMEANVALSHIPQSEHLERLKTTGGHPDDRTQPSLPVIHRSLANPAPLGLLSFATGTLPA